jgi:3-deoxy-D-manno-octulosonate 8-phosphate phosphatase (KDO 8-P phosphatase)
MKSMELTAVERAKRIKVLLFDVDGVLTDGGIWLFPRPAGAEETAHSARLASLEGKGGFGINSTSMVEAKGFHAHDGLGISLARIGGLTCGIITKRVSDTVALRARDLRLEHVYMGQAHKMNAVKEIMEKTGATLEEICFVGDDVVDLPVLRVCGLAIGVANAREIVKKTVHWITPHEGGHGAGRDAIEFILEAQDKLAYAIEEYCNEGSAIAASADIGQGGF